MVKYHESGTVCEATKKPCPLGVSEHIEADSKEEFERKLGERYGLFGSSDVSWDVAVAGELKRLESVERELKGLGLNSNLVKNAEFYGLTIVADDYAVSSDNILKSKFSSLVVFKDAGGNHYLLHDGGPSFMHGARTVPFNNRTVSELMPFRSVDEFNEAGVRDVNGGTLMEFRNKVYESFKS